MAASLIDDRSATIPLAAMPLVHAVSAGNAFRAEYSDPTVISFREAALTWLRFMAGIKQSVSLRKKAAPPILLLSCLFTFRKKAIKLSGARAYSFSLKATF
jgi:hypothetical protein